MSVEYEPKEGDLRVWWIPQVPMEPFYVWVPSLWEAARLLETLARYDAFQFEKRIKPDYSNVGGLDMLEKDGTWCDWEDEQGRGLEEWYEEMRDKEPNYNGQVGQLFLPGFPR